MPVPTIIGRRTWEGEIDEGGNRSYEMESLVYTEDHRYGPAAIMQTPGLPRPGNWWLWNDYASQDVDLWAWCRPNMRVRRFAPKPHHPGRYWAVQQRFSTKPPTGLEQKYGGSPVGGGGGGGGSYCYDQSVQDPLLEPQTVSGGFQTKQRIGEYAHNVLITGASSRSQTKITNSSHEKIKGPQNEWDEPTMTVTVSQNVPLLQFTLLCQLFNKVNTAPMWGFGIRRVKLQEIRWERLLYGLCYMYYKRTFTFAINPDTWDRDILDEGTKALYGKWSTSSNSGWIVAAKLPDGVTTPDPDNPSHYIRVKDRNENLMKVVLNGAGIPFGGATGTNETEGNIHVEYYREADLFQLGVPSSF